MYHTGNDETASHVLAKYFTTELDHLPTATINKIPSKQTLNHVGSNLLTLGYGLSLVKFMLENHVIKLQKLAKKKKIPLS